MTGRPPACSHAVLTTALAIDSSCTPQLLDRVEHHPDGALYRPHNRVAQPEADVLEHLGLARDHQHAARPAAHVLDEPKHGLRVHTVRVEHLPILDRPLD